MSMTQSRFCIPLLALIVGLSTGACAQTKSAVPKKEYEPHVGQSGKDVIWVPTPQALVDRMLRLGKVTPSDYLIDLGSGDGRTVITAAKRGTRALGIEYNPDMVALSRRAAKNEGVEGRAEFKQADLFATDFSAATVLTMFLLPDINLRLRDTILDMKPGTRVVSNSFTMGDWKWEDSAVATKDEGCEQYCTAYLWIVPAKVEGTWNTPQGTLKLEQEFQMLSGSLTAGGRSLKVSGRLTGDQINFSAGSARYMGRVNGERIEGTMQNRSNAQAWRAVRVTK
jgi:hypothetical protein